MRAAILVALLLFSSVASARDGRFPLAGLSAPTTGDGGEPWTRCSTLPNPPFATTALTPATSASDLHDDIMAVCGTGCIITLAPGTYTGNVVFGDAALKAGSITPSGEVVIRGLDPANPPLIRATVNLKAAVVHAKNVTARLRLEDVILDGRRIEQTAAGMETVCPDTAPANGICDSGQSETLQHGFGTRSTIAGITKSCLLRVQTREMVGSGFNLSTPVASTVEDSTVAGSGCTPATCPAMSIPADATTNAILFNGIGITMSSGYDSDVIESTVDGATKIGIECFSNSRRCGVYGNTVTNAGIAGIVLNESYGTVERNTVSTIGLMFSPNGLDYNVGQGIQFVNGDTYNTAGHIVSIQSNSISNTFGSGIQVDVAGTAYQLARVDVSGNSVIRSCNGGTRVDSAGLELGDPNYDIAQITSSDNSTSDTGCIDGLRVHNVRSHTNFRNSAVGGVDVDDVDEFEGISMGITGNFDVDADTKGKVRACTLTGSLIGATGLSREDCGASPTSGTSLWDTMIWTMDEWG